MVLTTSDRILSDLILTGFIAGWVGLAVGIGLGVLIGLACRPRVHHARRR